MARSWRVRLMLLIVVMLALAGFGGYWAVAAMIRSSAAAPFKAHLAEYLAPTVGPGQAAPVGGKMVVVDKNTQDIDSDVFFGLPDALRASRPEEVGTVVWLEYGRERGMGVYGNDHLPSFIQTCKVTVIDQASRSVIATTLLHGGAPPETINEGAKEGVGPRPTAEVIAYLKGLPRQ
jgi:hypothetical protein